MKKCIKNVKKKLLVVNCSVASNEQQPKKKLIKVKYVVTCGQQWDVLPHATAILFYF